MPPKKLPPNTVNIHINTDQLCNVCVKLDIKNFFETTAGAHRDVPHRSCLKELDTAAKKGCLLCVVFKAALVQKAPPFQTNPNAWLKQQIILRALTTDKGALFEIKVRAGTEIAGYCSVFPLINSLQTGKRAAVQIPADKIKGRQIHPADSNEGFALLRNWIKQCEETHGDKCNGKHGLPTLPKRVINVGKSDDKQVRLEIPASGRRGKYIALSHCWGPRQPIRTLTTNYAQHQQGIPINHLTNTFRDAVTVARNLGIQYLWIDSLCIVQDSASDWDTEASKMGLVYRQAYLVVAAAYSPDGNGGCLSAQRRKGYSWINWTLANGVGMVGVTPPLQDFGHLDSTPLHKRAWVLQERILALRTIHYAPRQMLSECRKARWTQSGVPPDILHGNRNIWNGRLHWDEERPFFYWDWYEVVENYTGRAITKEEDRLPALSGLASTLAATKAMPQYVAGLWVDHLAWGLLWRKTRDWLHPTAHYRAPSFSWASMNGKVRFLHHADLNTPSMVILSDIKDITFDVQPLGSDKRGRLKGGHVAFTGRIIECDPRVDPRSVGYKKPPGVMPALKLTVDYIYAAGGKRLGIVWFDREFRSGETQGKLYLLRIGRMFHHDKDENQKYYKPFPTLFYALVLRATAEKGKFKRVGYAEHKTWSPQEAKAPDPWASSPRSNVVLL